MTGRWSRCAGAILVLAAVATMLQWAEAAPVAAGPTWYETQCSADRSCPGWLSFYYQYPCNPDRDDSCSAATPALNYHGLERGTYRWYTETSAPAGDQGWVLPPSQNAHKDDPGNLAILSLLRSDFRTNYGNDWTECYDHPPDRGRCPNDEELTRWHRLGRDTEGALGIQIPTENRLTTFSDRLPTDREGVYVLINQAIASGNYESEPGYWHSPYKATCWPQDYWLWLHFQNGEAFRQTRAYSPYGPGNRLPPEPPSGCDQILTYEEAASGSRSQHAEVAYAWWRMEHMIGDLTGRIAGRPVVWGLTSDWEMDPQLTSPDNPYGDGEQPDGVLSCVAQSTIGGKRSRLPNWFIHAYYDQRRGDVQVPPTFRSALRRPSNGEDLSEGWCYVLPMQALSSTFPGSFVKDTYSWPPEYWRKYPDGEPDFNQLTMRVLIGGDPPNNPTQAVGVMPSMGWERRYVLYEEASTGMLGIWGTSSWVPCSRVRAPGEGSTLIRRGCVQTSESFQFRWYSPALWGWQGANRDSGRFLDLTTPEILSDGDYLAWDRYTPHIALSNYVSRYLEGRRTHKRDPLGAGYSTNIYREHHLQLIRCSDSGNADERHCLRQVDGRAVGLIQYQRIEPEHCREAPYLDGWWNLDELDCLPEWLARYGIRLRNLPYSDFPNIDYFWGHSLATFVRAWSDGRYYPAMECNGEVVDANRDPYHAPSPCGRSVPAAAITWQARVNDWSNLGGPA